MTRILFLILFVVATVGSAGAQDADTLKPIVPALDSAAALPDTLSAPVDSLAADSLSQIPDSLQAVDSLSFEERLERFKKASRPRLPRLSRFDSLLTYFAAEQFNQDGGRKRSIFRDAGDYFKFDPSYFVIDYQSTPMRKTVQPFGLSGNRMSFIVNGRRLTPFDHIIEPDGLVDLNDIPTAIDSGLYTLPGATGQLFGARQAIASLVTGPRSSGNNEPITGLLGEEGDLGWSWVRGWYARNFRSGREIDASVGYRQADGIRLGRWDDSYHYFGDAYFPVGEQYGLKAGGHLYNREGRLAVRPDSALFAASHTQNITRSRFDRSGSIEFDRHDSAFTTRYAVGWQHSRQASYLDPDYRARYNLLTNIGYIDITKMLGSKLAFGRLEGGTRKYDEFGEVNERTVFDGTMGLASLSGDFAWAVTAGAGYSEPFGFTPRGALVIRGRKGRLFSFLSLGYAEREPSLLELHMNFQSAEIYGRNNGVDDYSNVGNPNLVTEKQTTGSLLLEYGSLGTAVGVQLNAGTISDGINWRIVDDTLRPQVTHFEPVNSDVDYMTVTLYERWQWSNFFNLSGGYSIHEVDYSDLDSTHYVPDQQAFVGAELHWRIKRRLTSLRFYGELVYNSGYHGYSESELGGEMIANAKITLGLKDFRFFLIWNNIMLEPDKARDWFQKGTRFFYYGLTWNFEG